MELTYEDYKSRLSIQEVLQDAGYHLNRRDGLRYPSYVRLDSEGRRIRGDKFIVTANGMCCFQPPERKNYNVISFIKEHADLFSDYTPGMSKDRLVNLVCCRLLNQPLELRAERVIEPRKEAKPFDIANYQCEAFDYDTWESQKRFYPYFKNRGITLDTQKAFCGCFVLASRQREDGKQFTNLSFPLSSPRWPGREPLGLEERSRPNADGKTAYKGLAAGSDATEGLWIAQLREHRSDLGSKPLGMAKDVYWFESAYDAMAYYQLMKRENPAGARDLGNAVFVSTAGNPSNTQIVRMLEQTSEANHHLCFDNDRAGQQFAANFKLLHHSMGLSEARLSVELPAGVKDWNEAIMSTGISANTHDVNRNDVGMHHGASAVVTAQPEASPSPTIDNHSRFHR